jgi:hypothetical protein
VAPISRISVKTHVGDFRENLLGISSSVEIGSELFRNLPQVQRIAQFSQRYYAAIQVLSSREDESVF